MGETVAAIVNTIAEARGARDEVTLFVDLKRCGQESETRINSWLQGKFSEFLERPFLLHNPLKVSNIDRF